MSQGVCALRSLCKPNYGGVQCVYSGHMQQRRAKSQKKVQKVLYTKKMKQRIPINWRDVNYNPAQIPSAWKPDNWDEKRKIDYKREEEMAKYIPGYKKKVPLEMQEDYQKEPAFFVGEETEISGSLKQSLFLTKSVMPVTGLPRQVMDFVDSHPIDMEDCSQDERVKQVLRHALLFDIDPRTLEIDQQAQPAKHDAYKIYSKPDRYVPLIMKELIRLCNIKLCQAGGYFNDRMSLEQLTSNITFKRSCDSFNNDLLPGIDPNWKIFMSSSPAIQVLSKRPLQPFATTAEVESSANIPLPNLYPILPVINLKQTHIYKDTMDTGLYDGFPRPNLHTIVMFNLHKLGTSELYAKMNQALFTSLYSRAMSVHGEAKVLETPLTGQCIASDGQNFQFMCMQLNTTDLSNDSGIKNMVWIDEEEPSELLDAVEDRPPSSTMYSECSHAVWWTPEYIDNYNPHVFKLFKALWLNGVAK
uniref:Large ribosomal subunit protein mL37 n=1 Tax=Ciona savignyi TaxID=51511 RepID=H2Z2H7_CIOSA